MLAAVWPVSSRASSMPPISAETTGSSSGRPRNLARLARACSPRPVRQSQRGDSGIRNTVEMRTIEMKMGKTKGMRHWTGRKLISKKPKLIHDSRTYPKLIKQPSSTVCAPRFLDPEHSDCQTGTVAESWPTPHPRIKRPTMNCAMWNEEHWRISPTRVRHAARKIIFRRPRTSPNLEQERAPRSAPIVNIATTAPWIVFLWVLTAPVVVTVSI